MESITTSFAVLLLFNNERLIFKGEVLNLIELNKIYI